MIKLYEPIVNILIFSGGNYLCNVRAINGFSIWKIITKKHLWIVIRYEINGELFIQSKYKDINEEKIEKVKELLEDYTKVNLEAEELCRTIPMITIINSVEDIIFDRN